MPVLAAAVVPVLLLQQRHGQQKDGGTGREKKGCVGFGFLTVTGTPGSGWVGDFGVGEW
jgi:hypothetical protein